MRINEKTYNSMPANLQKLFIKLHNPGKEAVLAEFAKAGESKSRKGAGPSYGKCEGVNEGWKRPSHFAYNNKPDAGYIDEGTPARFFMSCEFTPADYAPIVYYAKASKSDRGEGNTHNTVKPTSLIRYLCKLITPPRGLILDPFAGSGTTCLAALQEGFHYIGIEKEPEYCEIARKRVAAVPARLDRWAEA